MREIVCLIAPPGGGKGTQARFLENAGFVRGEMSAIIDRYHVRDKGSSSLLPDSLTIDFMRRFIAELSPRSNVVVDGFPRTIEQGKFILGMNLASNVLTEVSFIVIDVSDDVVKTRVANRRLETEKLGLEARPDDDASVHARRLEVYRKNIEPLLEYLRNFYPEFFFEVDGNGSPEEVRVRISQVLSNLLVK